MITEYTLRCLGSGTSLDDATLPLESGTSQTPAFLRTEYAEKKLTAGTNGDGLFRFASWLPVRRKIKGSSAPVTWHSEGLGPKLGLNELYITFSGYWPDRGVEMVTGTFKECEAYSVCSRLPEDFNSTLVVASAGNTARAFIDVCSKNEIPLIVVVPESVLETIWGDHDVSSCVRLIVVGGNADYYDAIVCAGIISGLDGYVAEGGAKNVARRDGMGCTMLSAATTIGTIPELYFQAVGSGTGAIAAWEANLRLLADGSYGDNKARLIVSQNAPFQVLYDSWRAGSRECVEIGADTAKHQIEQTFAKVLSNRKPPYSITGGLFDALTDTRGDVMLSDNDNARKAARMFLETEGIDIDPAAAVAVATLIEQSERGSISPDTVVMLNITGGGYSLLRKQKNIRQVSPSMTIDPADCSRDRIETMMRKL